MPEGSRVARHCVSEGFERERRPTTEFGVLFQLRKMQQQVDRERSAGRRRVVSNVARPSNQLLRIFGGVEESTGGVIPEPFDHCVGDLLRALDPALIEGELVDAEKAEGNRRVIFEESADARDTVFV